MTRASCGESILEQVKCSRSSRCRLVPASRDSSPTAAIDSSAEAETAAKYGLCGDLVRKMDEPERSAGDVRARGCRDIPSNIFAASNLWFHIDDCAHIGRRPSCYVGFDLRGPSVAHGHAKAFERPPCALSVQDQLRAAFVELRKKRLGFRGIRSARVKLVDDLLLASHAQLARRHVSLGNSEDGLYHQAVHRAHYPLDRSVSRLFMSLYIFETPPKWYCGPDLHHSRARAMC